MKTIIAIIAAMLIMDCSAVLAQTDQPESGSVEQKKQYLYEWTDEQGGVHITDGLGRVPEQYRSAARRIESVRGQEPEPQQMQQGRSSGYRTDNSEREKTQWQSKIISWKSRLANAADRYRNLEKERDEQFRAWGSAALAPIANRLRAEQLEQEMKKAQMEIDQAKHMLDEVIPEEARKAGVPPGWLREVE